MVNSYWQWFSCEREVRNNHGKNAFAVIPNDLIKSHILGHAPFKYYRLFSKFLKAPNHIMWILML